MISKIFNLIGYEIKRKNNFNDRYANFIVELNENERELIKNFEKKSLVSELNLWSIYQSLKYIKNHNIDGDIIECGVYNGNTLSFIGIFINLSGASKTNEHKKHKVEKNEHVEFNLEPLPTDTPIELRENLPNEKVTSPAFDEMGNKISARGNGLKAGSLLINTRGKNGGVPTTRLGDFAGASALRIIDNDFGTPERIVTLKNSGLPFTAYAEYERDALLPVSAKDIENNPGPMRVAKEMATLGQVYMPEEDSVQEGTFRQPTLSHNKIDIKGPFLERTNKTK